MAQIQNQDSTLTNSETSPDDSNDGLSVIKEQQDPLMDEPDHEEIDVGRPDNR